MSYHDMISTQINHRQGIVEMGFLSLTTSKDMAVAYSEGDALSTVLKIERGDLSCGALVAPLSFYFLEEETLFGPLCYLERAGDPVLAFTPSGGVLTEVRAPGGRGGAGVGIMV